MLKRLKYKVQFNTGLTLSNDILFESGLTALTGPNESGKSFVLEMVRFALFGTAALRGKITDLVKYDVELEWELRGKTHKVRRTPGKAMMEGVSGVTAVDAHIIKLFGYGLNVFDIANNCTQGKIEALTELKPLDRKRVVDKTIGFDVIDKVSEYVADKASEARGAVKAINPVLPKAPEQPTGYQPSQLVEDQLHGLQPLALELAEIKGWLSVPRRSPVAPTPVSPCDKAEVDHFDKIKAQLAGLPEPVYNIEQLDEMEVGWKNYVEYHEFRQKHGDRPHEDAQAYRDRLAGFRLYHRWVEKSALQSRLSDHLSKRATCPSCGTDFSIEQRHIDGLRKQLEAYGDVPEGGVEQPEGSEFDIELKLRRALAWADRPVGIPAKPSLDPRQIKLQRQALATAHLRPLPPDPTPRWRAWVAYQDALARHQTEVETFAAYSAEKEAKILRMKEIEPAESQIVALQENLKSSLAYEAQVAAYNTALERYVKDKENKDEAEAELKQFENATKGLKTLRSRIKQHLMPSLNKAASYLASQMSGGKHTSIVIDENFESILVDGQEISTLSGSAKSVANLAIRIGLGQVLTNKVFSVFMGDELDCFMDDDRTGHTAECLNGLTKTIKQVILVSHKQITADNLISLREGAYNAGTRTGLEGLPVLH